MRQRQLRLRLPLLHHLQSLTQAHPLLQMEPRSLQGRWISLPLVQQARLQPLELLNLQLHLLPQLVLHLLICMLLPRKLSLVGGRHSLRVHLGIRPPSLHVTGRGQARLAVALP